MVRQTKTGTTEIIITDIETTGIITTIARQETIMKEEKITSLSHKVFGAICCICIATLLFSCGRPETFFQFKEIKGAVWEKNDTLVFDVDSFRISPDKKYNIAVEITNNNFYPYSNIWISIHCDSMFCDSTGNIVRHEFLLADKSGKWSGAGFGALYQSSFTLDQEIIFNEKRNYFFKVVHDMQDNSLKGIERIGIKINETK